MATSMLGLCLGVGIGLVAPFSYERHPAGLPRRKIEAKARRLKSNENEIFVVDGDNCRGKANWAWSAAELSSLYSALAEKEEINSLLFLDHAEIRQAMPLSPCLTLAFAGRKSTADDAIYESIEWFLAQDNTTSLALVTSDFGLRARIDYLAAKDKRQFPYRRRRVRFIPSQVLNDVLMEAELVLDQQDYVTRFEKTRSELADYLGTPSLSSSKSRRRRALRVLDQPDGTRRIHREQTWMRILLAERLRLAICTADCSQIHSTSNLLTHFVHFYSDSLPRNDTQKLILLHPLHDKQQRRDLVRFAQALRTKHAKTDTTIEPQQEELNSPIEIIETSADVTTPFTNEANTISLRPPSKRERRRRARRSRILAYTPKTTSPLTTLLKDRDELEDILWHWLRDIPFPLIEHDEKTLDS